jgi:RNA polymerase sigma-70 factor (ECF subfamily)
MSDELLVVRCQLGEREAFAELVHEWHPAVERYVGRMLGGSDDDVVQEIWLALVKGLPRLRRPNRFSPWLFTIARRAVMNRLRDAYAHPEPEPIDDMPQGGVDQPDDGEADGVVDRQAQICAVPVGTVTSRLNRARALLRQELVRKGYHA